MMDHKKRDYEKEYAKMKRFSLIFAIAIGIWTMVSICVVLYVGFGTYIGPINSFMWVGVVGILFPIGLIAAKIVYTHMQKIITQNYGMYDNIVDNVNMI